MHFGVTSLKMETMKLPLKFLALCLWVVAACGGTMTNVPNVYVDKDFGPDLDTVMLATDGFAPAGVAMRVTILPHDELQTLAGFHTPNAIYVFATHRMDEADCPYLDTPVINPAITKASGGSAVSCIDVDYIHNTKTPEGVDLVMRRAVTHELGHALMGPEHFGDGLMVNSYLGDVVPQCDDYRRLVSVIDNTVLPERCRQ